MRPKRYVLLTVGADDRLCHLTIYLPCDLFAPEKIPCRRQPSGIQEKRSLGSDRVGLYRACDYTVTRYRKKLKA